MPKNVKGDLKVRNDWSARCENCAYWRRAVDNNRVGRCLRYAPRPPQRTAVWPETRWDYWCGEIEATSEVKSALQELQKEKAHA